MSNREAVTASDAPQAAGPYSHAVKSNGILFCSGQVPIDPATGKLVEGSIGDQTRRCLDNLTTVAAGAGADLSDAVRMGIYVTDISVFGEVNEAYGEYFPSDPPARTTIGVAALPLGAQVEIDAMIALRD
ncbi:MAG: 2-iminobutanoate/2-iminopropanoate deaminase [Solirubrobacteraceae bacterium]|jgi:2-iminobutanoate/2-iminopropanoate deaminase|nr:2-iminobutanoate/2-iminopropanoate deaminase [Solirubrobacteraceae bacterium]